MSFNPTHTPLGTPVFTSFLFRDRPYVVDVDGNMFRISTEGEDPNLWRWDFVAVL